MNIFVSYSRKDSAVRRAIVNELNRIPGVVTLFDRQEIDEGTNIHPRISEMLDKAEIVIALITSISLESKEVLEELSRAHERKIMILPVLETTVDLKKMPHYLRDILSFEYTDETFDSTLDDLVKYIEKKNSQSSVIVANVSPHAKSIQPSTVKKVKSEDLYWLQRSNIGRELLEQVITLCNINYFHVDILDKSYSIPLFISPNTFLPDDWTKTFIYGLFKLEKKKLKNKKVVEIGVGSGILPIVLSKNKEYKFKHYTGYDIDSLAGEVARINLDWNGLTDISTIGSGGSIFESESKDVKNENYADIVIANVPQVPSLSQSQRQVTDFFDYYPMPSKVTGEKENWAKQGLWLVAQILEESKKRLAKDGSVVVCVGGRPELVHVEQMFDAIGFNSHVLHQNRIEQDPGTDISAFVHFEKSDGIKYEFFSHATKQAGIGAAVAFNRIASGDICYHNVYVIEGTLK